MSDPPPPAPKEHSDEAGAERLPAARPEVTEEVLAQAPPEIQEYVRWAMKFESSAFPFPETLEGYERVLPGGGERLMTQMEKEGDHRRWLDRTFVYYRFTGLVLGFIVAMTTVLGGIILAFTDHSAVGLTILIVDLAALVGIFVLNQYLPSKRRNGGDTGAVPSN